MDSSSSEEDRKEEEEETLALQSPPHFSRSPSNDHFENLNKEKSASIIEFRSAFSDKENTEMNDYDCIRFLIAREWNVEKAITMKQYDFKMRRNHQCHLLLSKPVDPFMDAISKLRREGIHYGCYGQDKRGNPVAYYFQGAFASVKMYKWISVQQYIDWMRYNLEVFLKNQFHPSGAAQMLVVIDASGLSFNARKNGHFTKAAIAFSDAHTPEYVSKVITVNSPKIASVLWASVKPWLPKQTVQKMSFHDKESTNSVLAEYIDKKYLPKMYGGDVDDETCFTPKLEKDDIEKSMKELMRMRDENAKRDNAKIMKLSAGQTEIVKVECKANTLVKWWFVMEAYNVLFTVRWKPHDQEEWIEIRESEKMGDESYDGGRFPVYSDYLVDCAGTMEFEFSNQHSKLRAKTLRYDIQTEVQSKSSF